MKRRIMDLILDSSEHHFLTTLDRLKDSLTGWIVVHFALSKRMSHAALIKDTKQIKDKITALRAKAHDQITEIQTEAAPLKSAFLYLFPDNDIVLLARAKDTAEKNLIHKLYKDFGAKIGADISHTGLLSNELYHYQKVADRKILAASKFESYIAMTDEHKVSSIDVRRARRGEPLVMLVEDDRFTASYTANLLNKDYDLVIARNGEEAIKRYIETAPDIVLLDIHLPGLSGHQTLQAIRTVDPHAFVVMLSVDTGKDSIVKARKIGAQSYLKKPFSKERLIHTIQASPFIGSHSRSLH